MERDSELYKLNKIVSTCTGSILYSPTKNEVDYTDLLFPLDIPTNSFLIPQDKHSDPFEMAHTCINKFKHTSVCLLIPGTTFDIYGTRHGKGAGWYDRFLSQLPTHWVRIGIIDSRKFSQYKLVRQAWDQPVDWIIIKDSDSWSVQKAEMPT